MIDPIWLELVGLFLTLMVLIYMIFGDNALFRIVTYSFVGIASGYVTVLVLFQVLLPRITSLLGTGNIAFIGLNLIPFVLGLLLLFKLSPRFSSIGTLPMAALVGVGAAVAVGGAIFGTLFGQVLGTISLFNLSGAGGDAAAQMARLLEGVFVLVGAVSTLAYFQFSARSRPAVSAEPAAGGAASGSTAAGTSTASAAILPETTGRRDLMLELLAKVGQVFIGITLGAVFAGVYTAAVSALIERIGFVIDVVFRVIEKFF